MESAGRSFGAAARLYDAVRPSYPPAAIGWALGTRPLRVLDLGAGTGLLTRGLLAAGHDVVCVEPDPQMAEVLAAAHPGTTVLLGDAEGIPLPDGSVDAVTCGQAYHWFDPPRALPQIRRVLRPEGRFAPVWNVRDERVAWIAEFSRIVRSSDADITRGWASGPVSPWFTEPVQGVFEHQVSMDTDHLLDLVHSRSYYLTATARRRAEIEERIRELTRTHPQLAGRKTFDMCYRTCVFLMHPA